jgi:hypothetical protein
MPVAPMSFLSLYRARPHLMTGTQLAAGDGVHNSESGTMLIISRAPSPTEPVTLRLEGELLGAWVEELERTCAEVLARGGGLGLDLAAVRFVGREGAELLRRLGRSGAVLGRPSPFVRAQLESWARVDAVRDRADGS